MAKSMGTVISIIILVAFGFSMGITHGQAWAFGEIFKLETKGTDYCGDFDATNFDFGEGVPLWVRVDSDTELTLSMTPGFELESTFVMTGKNYARTSTGGAFVGSVLFEDGSWATIRGKWFSDTAGTLTKLKGKFIENMVFSDDCFSIGKFNTTDLLVAIDTPPETPSSFPNPPPAPPPVTEPTPAFFGGTWSGYMVFVDEIDTLVLTQTGSNITGTYQGPFSLVGTITGTITGNSMAFELITTTPSCPGMMTGTATIDGIDMDVQGSRTDCNGTFGINGFMIKAV